MIEVSENDLIEEIKRLKSHNDQLMTENQRLREMLNLPPTLAPALAPIIDVNQISCEAVHKHSTPDEKIDLFLSLFPACFKALQKQRTWDIDAGFVR